ncbi:long-chain-fatty-acid--CoA ligase [Campylobacter canadensis]|uniref:long-chain-fatty-acid--CoA ligase n=1 Tax=Campylobacter canadensis TaxID=449520 RepID=UPI001CCBF52F|nr:long-chain-fatty-acid--CoA ligase [Campylobacter canadensis]MBZ7994961.1 long-chain-fatty-acid--CoA ligase [Campylobacter canadensis]
MQNYYEYLQHNAKLNKTAIFYEKEKISFKQLKNLVDKMISFLKENGVKENDNIAFIMQNSVEFIILYFAITSLKAVAIPINTMLKVEEYEHIVKDSNAKLLIIDEEIKEAMKLRVDVKTLKLEELKNYKNYDAIKDYVCNASLEDSVHIIYTSGTTGVAKGVVLSYKNILSNIKMANLDFKINDNDRFIAYLPMFHSFTLTACVLLPLILGKSLVVCKNILPFSNVLKQVLLKRVSVLFSVPVILNTILKHKLPWYFLFFHRLRVIISGSSPLSENTIIQYKKIFKNTTILEGYGLSECAPIVGVNRLNAQKINSVGIPLHSYKVKVVDDEGMELVSGEIGELIVNGDCVMKGYYNKPELTKEVIENGWLKTGDLARIDNDGFIYIIDRKKDLIISKGINIYPREIEDILYFHPKIDSCAVLGKKESDLDESIVCFVCLKENENISSDELRKYLKQHLANYKIPKLFIFKDELPKNAAGKVLKKELKKEL